MKSLFAARGLSVIAGPIVALLLLPFQATVGRADWPNDNLTKYYQPPDLTDVGYNVLAAMPPAGSGVGQPIILADDFPCTQTGPITDIHIWASWLGDSAALNIAPVPITLMIWSDVPASSSGPSHPGVVLWSQTFLPGGALPGYYKVVPKGFTPSPFWNPDPPPAGNIEGNDSVVWLYNFYTVPGNEFVQQGTAAAPTNYWLSVTAGTNVVAFGWRTSAIHYGDNAVFGHLNSTGMVPLGDWQELSSPQSPSRSLDLAFAITTTNQPPSPPPPNPTAKWEQDPDLLSGYGLDVNATAPNAANGLLTLADDFKCEVVGPITNIQFWASLNNDAAPGGQTFVVSLWSDFPKSGGGFSQPFQRLWTQTYHPSDYTYAPAGAGDEHYYDPTTGALSSESAVWLYTFNLFPTNPFCQQGHGTVYWVSIAAISPPAAFIQWGWKTSTNHWGDTGVFGKVDALSGAVLVPWEPLFNPVFTGAVALPVDFAFRINTGPPCADCDPALGAAVIQPPDTSPNGLDVQALQPAMVGDDFPCKIRGPISGFTIFGSWLNDQVDTNALFQVTLWSDVPALPGVSPNSHPGQSLCSALFYPPQTVGDVLRYQYGLVRSNLQETFYNPNLPGRAGLIGTDTQIWGYTFFPFVPSCFSQAGSPFAPMTYWLTVSYIPGPSGPAGGTSSDLFGWKTSPVHFQDPAVSGSNGATWMSLSDPRSGTALDLSKIVYKFPVTGINKDLYNLTGATADGIQIVLMGPHVITWHYDDSPPWSFMTYLTSAGDTVLQWNGRTIPPGGVTHVGFETPGVSLPTILAINWLNGSTVLGPVVQGNWHLLGDPIASFDNDFYSGNVSVGQGTVEFYNTPPPLDQMIDGGARRPMATQQLQHPPDPCFPGEAGLVPIPTPPNGATYALFVVPLEDPLGNPGAMDFVLVPLEAASPPEIQSVNLTAGNVLVDWSSVYGEMYQLQSTPVLDASPIWSNVGNQIMAVGGDTIVSVPVGGNQSFYRVELVPSP
jgi:hypothetical protein